MAEPAIDADAELTEADDEFIVQPKKRKIEAEMDITPMIDITFLLLIFFLVASKMEESSAIKLPDAKHGQVVPMTNSIVITIANLGGDEVAVFKGGTKSPQSEFPAGKPEEQNKAIADYVKEMADADLTGDLNHVLIMAEKGVKFREVSRVLGAANQGAEKRMHVAVMQAN